MNKYFGITLYCDLLLKLVIIENILYLSVKQHAHPHLIVGIDLTFLRQTLLYLFIYPSSDTKHQVKMKVIEDPNRAQKAIKRSMLDITKKTGF